MSEILEHRIDFKVVVAATGANPNGDPLNGNRPRQTSDGFGEISDVAIKRKVRNRLQDLNYKVFVQSADRADDEAKSLKDRAEGNEALKKMMDTGNNEGFAQLANETWIDVRSFGQVFAFKGKGKGKNKNKGISVGVRGPVSITRARSIAPIAINDMQITKSVNSETTDGKGSDTMGMKYSVDFAVYEFSGSINVQLAEKTGFTDEDAKAIHKALETLFDNDESSARPAGSMEVLRVYWWEQDGKLGKVSPAKIFRTVKVTPKEGKFDVRNFDDVDFATADQLATKIEGAKCNIYQG
jgi:CRISPR-associated protein Csd2